MNGMDAFWRIEKPETIGTQKEFFARLGKQDGISRAVYKQAELKPPQPKARRIERKTFERVVFSHTTIKLLTFDQCTFKDCLFVGARIERCEFRFCQFVNTNTHKIDIVETYIDPRSFQECLDSKRHQNIGVHLYQALLRNSRDMMQIEFERDARFLFLQWKRFEDGYYLPKPWARAFCSTSAFRRLFRILGRFLYEKLLGSGVRIWTFVRTIFGVVALAFAMNYLFADAFGLQRHGVAVSTWTESLYFTIISLTTLGYGDITPSTTVGQVWASFQSVLGFIMFAMLAAMLYRRAAP